jgi:hypothetical protein
MNVKRILLAALLLSSARPLRAGDDRLAIDASLWERNGRNAAVRSLLIPGWGQAFNRQTARAGTFFLLAGGCLAVSLGMHEKALESYHAYQSMGVVEGPSYDRYKRQRNVSFLAGSLSALFWGWSVRDAYREGSRAARIRKTPVSRARSWEMALGPDSLTLARRFGGDRAE